MIFFKRPGWRGPAKGGVCEVQLSTAARLRFGAVHSNMTVHTYFILPKVSVVRVDTNNHSGHRILYIDQT